MGNLFGVRRRAPTITPQDRAILQLKQQRDQIRIYQKKTENDLEKNKNLAVTLFQKGMKDRAIIVLRRKKYMEEIVNRTEKQLETLEQLVCDIEYTQIEVSVVEGLKVATDALKQLNSLMVGSIEQLMQDNEEASAKQKEISEILSRTNERYDEADLLEELAQVDVGEDNTTLKTYDLPEIPTHEPNEPNPSDESNPTEEPKKQNTKIRQLESAG